jgi:hypothetical protein
MLQCTVAERWTDLPDLVAQRDDAVESHPAEPAQMLRHFPCDVDPSLRHHAHRVRVQRLRMTPRAARLSAMPGPVLEEGLGHLRARAVPGTQEQDARREVRRKGRGVEELELETGLQASAGCAEQLTTPPQVDRVVRVATVRRAPAGRHELRVAELAEVIRDEVLRFFEKLGELADAKVGDRELPEQPPAERVGDQLQELEG